MLTERQRMILSAIIDDYVRSAEPIGSRSISKRGNVGFSPATIRNEMSDLEEMGYLEQPHTSAGRIPSHKGYRYYVDHLLQHGTLHNNDLDSMKGAFAERIQEMEGVIQHVAGMLSSLTNYTSIVLGPEVFSTTLKHLQIIPLTETTAVAIIVMNTGHVENKTVSIPEGIRMSEIEKVVNILNAKLKNVPLIEFKSRLYNEISSELSKYVNGYQELLSVVESVLQSNEKDRVFLSGMTNMLTQPEFKDVDKVKSIFDLLEEAPTLIKLFTSSNEGIEIKIGAENSIEAINNCSLITASYSIGDKPLGTIGILGPTRMEYGRVISLMEHLSKHLEVVLGRWYGK
ncbi:MULTISPECIES: heat-inducible transcriptional repressor HrcA [unclassified Paenibacillus]|uniref:heat-inducible transcriptional repressor HrcA n=1 Tax=unclassified Paenibacillus TaxID=185978 RepID=UPI000709CA2C|nr:MULTISPECIES: heat-inducible transcriptional repressor HrcA [unclassified Paenibacillus]KQX64822.1 HrcA family transcriptional regulator [Paenibacillus sp. Root444D2]KRE52073.1 HrcA family transcriptional regulator [Paenibacillus sp. Soil724D2]